MTPTVARARPWLPASASPAGAVAADQELLGMNWFVQGVVGTTE